MQTELFLFNKINSALHKTLKWESLWTDLLLLYFLFPFPLLLVAQHQAINISKTKHHKVCSRKLLNIRQRNQKSPPSWASQIQEPILITVMKNGLTLWITISLMPPHSSRSLDYWRVVHRHRQKYSKSNLKTKRSENGRSQKITARWKPVLFNNALYRLELFYENICNYYTHCLNFFTEWL